MRPQQQNRRMRGRNNNNNNNSNNNNTRKGPNPLTRNYESNGPDVKIRGSAQQIAEKYTTLARDAMSAGDRVIAENYLQHAEHYNRIIASAMAQLQGQNPQVRDSRDDFEDGDEDRDDMDTNGGFEQQPHQPQHQHANQPQGSGPQPVIEGVPAEVMLENETAGRSGEERHSNGPTQQSLPLGGGQPNGSHTANGAPAEDAGPRRPRRPRRGRGRGDQEQGVEAAAGDEAPGAAIEVPAESPPVVVADS